MDTNHPTLPSLNEIIKETLRQTVKGPITGEFTVDKFHKHK
jgi:hypothetical protein